MGAEVDRTLARLAEIVGTAHVVTDPDVTAGSAVDWTGRFRGATPAVVRPGSVEEVAAVLAVCSATGVAVVPQGGNTGLVGGSVPLHDEVVLSTRRLDSVDPVDATAMQVTAGAGVTIGRLDRVARAHGLAYGVDLASRDSATVGGTIATNAGGVHLMRWGGTRQQVLGVEAVLADGSVVRHLAGLAKDNTGYDLAGLLCGSEGTLAVVTAARLRLVPHLPERVVALVAFESVAEAVTAVGGWRRRLDSLMALELILDDGMALVCATEGRPPPFAHHWPAYVLLEAAGAVDPTDAVAAVIDATPSVRDVAVAPDEGARSELWAYRELHTTAINTLGAPHKLDVTLPAGEMAAFVDEVRGAVADVAPGARTWIFGHLGDGNLHVNVTGVEPGDDRVDGLVLRLVAERGGSISAEHGIGAAKRRWLGLNRSPAEIAAFRAIKQALDPKRILNPHVLLPDDGAGA